MLKTIQKVWKSGMERISEQNWQIIQPYSNNILRHWGRNPPISNSIPLESDSPDLDLPESDNVNVPDLVLHLPESDDSYAAWFSDD